MPLGCTVTVPGHKRAFVVGNPFCYLIGTESVVVFGYQVKNGDGQCERCSSEMIVIRNANGRESGIVAGFFADGQIAQMNHLTTGRILTGDFGMERSDRMPDGSCLQVPPLQPFAQPRIRTRTHQMIVFQPQSTLVTIRFKEISTVIYYYYLPARCLVDVADNELLF